MDWSKQSEVAQNLEREAAIHSVVNEVSNIFLLINERKNENEVKERINYLVKKVNNLKERYE